MLDLIMVNLPFRSIKFETNSGRKIEYFDHRHQNCIMYKVLTSTDNEKEEGGFVRDQAIRDNQFKGDYVAAEKIIDGLGFKTILQINNNNRILF